MTTTPDIPPASTSQTAPETVPSASSAPPPLAVDEQATNDLIVATSRKAASAAKRDQAAALGFDSAEAMEAFVAAARARELADMTEADRVKAQAAADSAAAADAIRTANETTSRANLQLALVAAGVNPDRLAPAMSLGLGQVLASTPDDPVDEAGAVESVKLLSPEWFGGPVTTPPVPRSGTTPPPPAKPPSSLPTGETARDRAKRKYEARRNR